MTELLSLYLNSNLLSYLALTEGFQLSEITIQYIMILLRIAEYGWTPCLRVFVVTPLSKLHPIDVMIYH